MLLSNKHSVQIVYYKKSSVQSNYMVVIADNMYVQHKI